MIRLLVSSQADSWHVFRSRHLFCAVVWVDVRRLGCPVAGFERKKEVRK